MSKDKRTLLRFAHALMLTVICFTYGDAQYISKLDQAQFISLQEFEEFRSNKAPDEDYLYLQTTERLKAEDIVLLSKIGVKIIKAHSNHTYFVRKEGSSKTSNISCLKKAKIAELSHEMKAHQDILNQSLPEWSIDGDDILAVIKVPQGNVKAYAEKLELEGVTVLQHNGISNFIKVSIPRSKMNDLLYLSYVWQVESLPAPPRSDAEDGRKLHRVNTVNSLNGNSKNYTGEGVGVLVRDDGEVFDHIDFKGRVDQSLSEASRGDHGDGVAGILCGAGNLNPDNAGMAFGAFMYVTDYSALFIGPTMELHNNNNVLVTNSSYSDGCNDGYTFSTEIVDQQMIENPTLMHVFSAGNDGESNCGYGAGNVWGNITGGHKIGKNVIAVANTNFLGTVVESSSRGPARDGRIKPDIAAHGFRHESTAESQGYMTFGGTSAAAPVVAGVTALMQDAHMQLYGEPGEAALLKSLMLNTATDNGNVGPDFIYGWGLLNADKAITALEEGRFLKSSIAEGEILNQNINVPDGVRELRVMVYWPEEEGQYSNQFTIFNDLDILVKDAEGNEYLPWYLDPTPNANNLAAPAVKGEDHLNNMEQVSILNPLAGAYNLEVLASRVPLGDAEFFITWDYIHDDVRLTHPNGGENLNQDEALLIQWDGPDHDEALKIELIDANGIVLQEKEVLGDAKYTFLNNVNNFTPEAKIRISSSIFSDESDESFSISKYPTNIEVIDVGLDQRLVWDEVIAAESYNIHLLGEKYMDIVTTTDTTYYDIPDSDEYKFSWIAVSANLPNDIQGKRTNAVSLRPSAKVFNNKNDQPCVDEPVIFETRAQDEYAVYDWNFGLGADPATASTLGPHEVVYSSHGQKFGVLKVEFDGGEDGDLFVFNVARQPIISDITTDRISSLEFQFSVETEHIDSLVWDMGDGSSYVTNVVDHAYAEEGVYELKLTVFTPCGIREQTLDINTSPSSSSNEEVLVVSLSPNPTDGYVNVSWPQTFETQRILVRDTRGRVVQQLQVNEEKIEKLIDLSSLVSGSYTLTLESSHGEALTTKLIKL